MAVSKHDHVGHMDWGDKKAECKSCGQVWHLTDKGWDAVGAEKPRPRYNKYRGRGGKKSVPKPTKKSSSVGTMRLRNLGQQQSAQPIKLHMDKKK